MREQDVATHLGSVLKDIYVPEGIAAQIVSSLRANLNRSEEDRMAALASIEQRLALIRTRMDKLYEDKLDGRIGEEFWERKYTEYQDQERDLKSKSAQLGRPVSEACVLTASRVFELASTAYSLYLTRNPAEQAQLLRSVLLNCSTDGVTLRPFYRKPFDLIFQRVQNQEWSGRADLNCRAAAAQHPSHSSFLRCAHRLWGARGRQFRAAG
jgi:hypothetical protein